jgi:hypothetical protein
LKSFGRRRVAAAQSRGTKVFKFSGELKMKFIIKRGGKCEVAVTEWVEVEAENAADAKRAAEFCDCDDLARIVHRDSTAPTWDDAEIDIFVDEPMEAGAYWAENNQRLAAEASRIDAMLVEVSNDIH